MGVVHAYTAVRVERGGARHGAGGPGGALGRDSPPLCLPAHPPPTAAWVGRAPGDDDVMPLPPHRPTNDVLWAALFVVAVTIYLLLIGALS